MSFSTCIKTFIITGLCFQLIYSSGCGRSNEETEGPSINCLTTSQWTPSVTGASASNHEAGTTVTTTVSTASGQVRGLGNSISASDLATVTFTVPAALGASGSISITAEPNSVPSELTAGSFYPFLVSVVDPNANEYVNLTSQCQSESFFTCSGGSCSQNSNCTIPGTAGGGASAFENSDDWLQRMLPPFGYYSQVTFPTCNWSGDTKECHFFEDNGGGGNGFIGATGEMPAGTYTAKFALLASNYSSVSNVSGTVKATIRVKSDSTDSNGAIDLNVIFIGDSNVGAAGSAAGQTNLNFLFQSVYDHYNQSNTGIKLGTITAYDASICSNNWQAMANPSISELEDLFTDVSGMVDQSSEGKAVNVIAVDTIPAGISGTVLGVAGGIGGPTVFGTGGSAVIFSFFEELETLDTGSVDAFELAKTISHEIGHQLGLNHLTEATASDSDQIPDSDTPDCSTLNGSGYITKATCKTESPCSGSCAGSTCPTVNDCSFNHIMYYSSTGDFDGEIFSPFSSKILNYSTLSQ